MQILIADDNVETLEQVRKFLEGQGHSIVTATDGDAALEHFKMQSPDGVFSTIALPKMGGIELLKEFQSIKPNLPFIFITRHDDANSLLTALNLGACDFITKPLSLPILHKCINKIKALQSNFQFNPYFLEHSVAETRQLEMGNDFEHINHIVAFITRDLPFYGIVGQTDHFTLDIVLAEALENAIMHGNLEIPSELKYDRYELFCEEGARRRNLPPYQDRKVYLSYEITQNSAKYVIRDEGPGFAHQKILDPKDSDNLFKINGHGILLIMNFMDEVFWNERGNEITMVRYRKRNAS